MNFQGFSSKFSDVAKKGAKVAGAAVVAGGVMAQKPVSQLTVSEMYKEYEDMPDSFNYSSPAEKQRAAELITRMSSEGYVKGGKLLDLSSVRRNEYNNLPEAFNYASNDEKESAAKLLNKMAAEGYVKNGEFVV